MIRARSITLYITIVLCVFSQSRLYGAVVLTEAEQLEQKRAQTKREMDAELRNASVSTCKNDWVEYFPRIDRGVNGGYTFDKYNQKPNYDYDKIGALEYSQALWDLNWDRIYAKIKKDGLIVSNHHAPGNGRRDKTTLHPTKALQIQSIADRFFKFLAYRKNGHIIMQSLFYFDFVPSPDAVDAAFLSAVHASNIEVLHWFKQHFGRDSYGVECSNIVKLRYEYKMYGLNSDKLGGGRFDLFCLVWPSPTTFLKAVYEAAWRKNHQVIAILRSLACDDIVDEALEAIAQADRFSAEMKRDSVVEGRDGADL